MNQHSVKSTPCMRAGDLVQCDTVSDAPYRKVLAVRDESILIDFGNWKGWVPSEAFKIILSGGRS